MQQQQQQLQKSEDRLFTEVVEENAKAPDKSRYAMVTHTAYELFQRDFATTGVEDVLMLNKTEEFKETTPNK